MAFQSEVVAERLVHWSDFMNQYHLPEWESIPDFGLYMEQVVDLIKSYFTYLPPETKDEKIITAAIINNYVRTKVMPGPVKKRYYRIHLAYLIMIVALKQGLSIAKLQEVIPNSSDPKEVEEVYRMFCGHHNKITHYMTEQVSVVAGKLLKEEKALEMGVETAEDLITMAAIAGGLGRLLAERLLTLKDVTDLKYKK